MRLEEQVDVDIAIFLDVRVRRLNVLRKPLSPEGLPKAVSRIDSLIQASSTLDITESVPVDHN